MNKQALSLAVAVAGAFPVASNALSLGDIESNSNLNQPLKAQIELLSSNAKEAQQLQVRLAPPSVFNRVGIERPNYLDNLRFTPSVQNGKPVILVSSDSPIQEPFVNFLLEVSWPQGQLLKEYTVLLDPPVLMQPGNTVAGGEASVRAEPRSTGVVSRPPSSTAQQQQQARQQQIRVEAQRRAQQQQRAAQQRAAQQRQQAQQQRAAQQRAQQPRQATNRTYRVRSGDTLYKVAARLRQSGVHTDQMMMALYRANPQAFIKGNIHGLKTGAILRAPSASEAGSMSRAQARRQARQQYAEWKKFRAKLAKNTVSQKVAAATSKASGGKASTKNDSAKTQSAAGNDKARLEVLGNKKSAAPDKVSAAGQERLAALEKQLSLARESLVTRQRENQELKSRVSDLESMLRKKNRLIQLRDQQLSQLQQGLSGDVKADAKAAGASKTAGTNDLSSTAKDIQNYVGSLNQDDTVLRGQTNDPHNPNQVAAAPSTPNTPDVKTAPQTNPLAPSTTAATPDDAPTKSEPSSPFMDQGSLVDDVMKLLTSPLAMYIGGGLLGLLALLFLLGRRKKKPEPEFDDSMAYADEIPPEANVDAGDDVFADLEKEVDKAENFVDSDDDFGNEKWDNDDPFATDDQPSNVTPTPATGAGDTVTKTASDDDDDVLTEANVYIAYGLHQQAESELKKALEKNPERLEYRHKLLENYFASNNQESFDYQAQAFVNADDAPNKDDLWKDILEWGSKLSPDNPLYSGGISGGGKLAAGIAATGAAAAVVSAATKADDTKDDLSIDADIDDALGALDAPAMGDLSDQDSAKDLESALSSLSDDDEVNLDDFDFDLDEFKQDDAQPVATAAAAAAAADDSDDVLDFGSMMDDAGDTAQSTANNVADTASDAANALPEFDDSDLDFDLEEALLPDNDVSTDDSAGGSAGLMAAAAGGAAAAAAGAVAAATSGGDDKVTDLNLHLDNNSGIKKILPQDTVYANGSEQAAEGEDNWLGDIDDALSFLDLPDEEIDLHEAHISTKLDLARAYLDMGDIEGARSTLEEVMVEGNDDQKREAEDLLHQTG